MANILSNLFSNFEGVSVIRFHALEHSEYLFFFGGGGGGIWKKFNILGKSRMGSINLQNTIFPTMTSAIPCKRHLEPFFLFLFYFRKH